MAGDTYILQCNPVSATPGNPSLEGASPCKVARAANTRHDWGAAHFSCCATPACQLSPCSARRCSAHASPAWCQHKTKLGQWPQECRAAFRDERERTKRRDPMPCEYGWVPHAAKHHCSTPHAAGCLGLLNLLYPASLVGLGTKPSGWCANRAHKHVCEAVWLHSGSCFRALLTRPAAK